MKYVYLLEKCIWNYHFLCQGTYSSKIKAFKRAKYLCKKDKCPRIVTQVSINTHLKEDIGAFKHWHFPKDSEVMVAELNLED